jgi:hypothetical protein
MLAQMRRRFPTAFPIAVGILFPTANYTQRGQEREASSTKEEKHEIVVAIDSKIHLPSWSWSGKQILLMTRTAHHQSSLQGIVRASRGKFGAAPHETSW